VTEGGKKLRRGARLWTIAVATFKSETYRYLRHSAPTDEEIAAVANSREATCICRMEPKPSG
jgi:hypothetical protein